MRYEPVNLTVFYKPCTFNSEGRRSGTCLKNAGKSGMIILYTGAKGSATYFERREVFECSLLRKISDFAYVYVTVI
jgi:hypothetical protein